MSMPLIQVHGANDVRTDTVEKPVPQENDVLLQVELCGICGSDLGYIAMGGLGITQPMPLGHELIGTIVEAGANISHVAVGDRVVMNPVANSNDIGNGGPEGGFAPFLLVRGAALDEGAVIKLPENISNDQGALVEPLSVAMHGCKQGSIQPTDKAVVFGAGPIGLCVVACLRYLGVKNIVSVDQSEFRLKAAEKLGATVFNANSKGLAHFLMEQQGAADLMGMPVAGTDIYFDATGAKAVFNSIVNLAKTRARVVVLGLHKEPVQFDLVNLLMRELNVIGSMAYPEEFPEVIEMLNSGVADIESLISHRYPLSEFDGALAQAQQADSSLKVMIECQHF